MASHNVKTNAKGYYTPNPHLKVDSQTSQTRDHEVFVAESTTFTPSGGGLALCGMPIKGNKKQQVALNDDGTPVERCRDTDRCCRCSMPIGSYFDHTCPRCCGIVCLGCLDDIKFITASYRCPCCGDQQHNEEALKQSLWYLKMYRNAQRAVGAVPILFAGLFGYGPEGESHSNRTAVQAFSKADEVEPAPPPVAPPPAPKPKAANGPPPPPPKPKTKAGASPAQEAPEYHTRPPAGWAEGAGAWRPDPSKVAAAAHQAATAQAAGGRRPSVGSNGQSASRAPNPFGSAATGQSPFRTRVPPGQQKH